MSQTSDKVYIVEDDRSIRHALRELVEAEGFTAQTFSSAEELFASTPLNTHGAGECMLLDIHLPGASGMSVLEKLSGRQPKLPVILISGHADVSLTVKAMQFGALDVIEKPFRGSELLARVHDAVAQSRHHIKQHLKATDLRQRYQRLTKRERQVMSAVVRGLLNKQTARELNLSTKTIEVHRSRMMEKMEAVSVADLVRISLDLERNGWLESESQSDASS
ncbi:MAG: response regulator transcription factor [Phycisphaeraceae bacterium]|nr:response regulator transcription factor [Phycisphaeraceae bacterium]